MNPLKQYLTKLQPEVFYRQHAGAHVPKKGDTMKCSVCGRKTHLLNNGKGPLVCCGKAMLKATLPVSEDMEMIHDIIRERLVNESAAKVMGCRAAAAGIVTWQRRMGRITDPGMKLRAQKKIASLKLKVHKCKQRGMMI